MKTHISPKRPLRTPARRRAEAGMSLVETLVAAGVLLVVAVSILPLFHRATQNNISGSDSSTASQLLRSGLEVNLSFSIDSQPFDMTDPTATIQPSGTGDVMIKPTLYWDPAALPSTTTTTDPLVHQLSSGAWVTDPTTASGTVLWERRSEIRQYQYADIDEGVTDVTGGGGVITAGNPRLFDQPLKAGASDGRRNFKEELIILDSLKGGVPDMRLYFVRTY